MTTETFISAQDIQQQERAARRTRDVCDVCAGWLEKFTQQHLYRVTTGQQPKYEAEVAPRLHPHRPLNRLERRWAQPFIDPTPRAVMPE